MGASVEIEGLREVLENIVKEKTRNAASKIANELTKFAEHSILGFYDHYQPKRYKRNGGLSTTYTRYYKNPHNKIYYGGVSLHEGSGSYYGWSGGKVVDVSSDFVTALAIFNGMHGNVEAFPSASNIPPRMSPAPFELINKKRDEILKNIDSYING